MTDRPKYHLGGTMVGGRCWWTVYARRPDGDDEAVSKPFLTRSYAQRLCDHLNEQDSPPRAEPGPTPGAAAYLRSLMADYVKAGQLDKAAEVWRDLERMRSLGRDRNITFALKDER